MWKHSWFLTIFLRINKLESLFAPCRYGWYQRGKNISIPIEKKMAIQINSSSLLRFKKYYKKIRHKKSHKIAIDIFKLEHIYFQSNTEVVLFETNLISQTRTIIPFNVSREMKVITLMLNMETEIKDCSLAKKKPTLHVFQKNIDLNN